MFQAERAEGSAIHSRRRAAVIPGGRTEISGSRNFAAQLAPLLDFRHMGRRMMKWVESGTYGTHIAFRSCPVVRAQPVRLPGAEPAVGRDLGRRESQPGQGLQFRLHLLPGRPHAGRARRGSSRPTRCWPSCGRRSSWSRPGRFTRRRSFATCRHTCGGSTTSPSPATASRRRTRISTS